MGYLIFFLVAMVIISIFPYLFQIVIGIWIISMVLNLFRPRNSQSFRQQQQQQQQYQQQNNQNEQSRPRPQGDIIDVEYTQRDAEDV